MKKNTFCVNCGKYGHITKECFEPITSYGIILFIEIMIKMKLLIKVLISKLILIKIKKLNIF